MTREHSTGFCFAPPLRLHASRLLHPVDQHAPGFAGLFLDLAVSCADRDLIVPKTAELVVASAADAASACKRADSYEALGR